MLKKKWRAGAAGAAAGIVNGLFGAGGGMLLVPLLSAWCGVMAPLCLVSLGIYALHGTLEAGESLPYLIGGIFGGAAGALLLRRIPVRLLHALFGLLILWGGLRLWR